MPRQKSLASMSVDALVKMRDDITATLATKAAALKKELAALGEGVASVGRAAMRSKRSTLAGTTVAPKYRGPGGVTWAGRGAEPVWMREAIKKGKKREDFLIDKSTVTAKKAAKKSKRGRPKKKR